MPGGLYPPPSVIESWPKSNYVDPVTQGSAMSTTAIVFSALSLAIVIARTYSRIFITKAPGADDLLVAVAAAFGIALTVMLVIQDRTWLIGHHIWDIPVSKLAGQRKNIYICEWCYITASCSVKISVLLFYRRLSVTFSKTFLVATYIGIVYNVLYFITFAIALLSLFRPIDSYWLSFDPSWAASHKYSHGDEAWSLPTAAALSVVGDFYSTVLPLLLIHYLDLPRRQKAALYALFGLGFLVVAAGIVRTILLDRVIAKTYDVTWVLWEDWIWTVVELNVAILAASAPALKPFFRRFLIDPIISSGRHVTLPYGSRRISSAERPGGAQRSTWSNNTATARDSNMPVDVEKIGIAMTEPHSKAEMLEDEIDDGVSTKRYRLRTSRDGKLVPVQIYEQRSFDAPSAYTANSTDYILPSSVAGDFNVSAELRQYRAQIEAQLPVLSQQDHQLNDPSKPKTRPRTQSSGMHGVLGPLARNPSRPGARSPAGTVTAEGSRVQRLQEPEQQQGYTHGRSISRGSERNFSLPSTTVVGSSPYQHIAGVDDDTYVSDRSSSQETLELPRQGSRDGIRRSVVGYAV